MALYSAGAVGVDIRPDTDNFWKILNAELHSRHPEVTVDVNTKGVARAKEQMRDLDGKTLTNVVKIDGDPSGLRAIDKAMQAQRKQWEKKPVTSRFDLDDTSFNEKIHRLSNQIKRTAGQTEAFVKKSQKSVADSLQDSLSRMRSARALYDKEATAASRRQTMLIKDEHAAYDMYAEAIENGRKRQEQLTRSQADVSKTLDWSIKKMKELREAREHRHRELVQEQSHPRAARTAQGPESRPEGGRQGDSGEQEGAEQALLRRFRQQGSGTAASYRLQHQEVGEGDRRHLQVFGRRAHAQGAAQ